MRVSVGSDINALKTDAYDRIAAAASSLRSKWISTVPGQDTEYSLKLEEAKTFQSYGDKYVDADDGVLWENFPFLFLDSKVDGEEMSEHADKIINRARNSACNLAAISQVRRIAKRRVSDATSRVDINAAVDFVCLDEVQNVLRKFLE